MIPRAIHYCWFGHSPLPDLVMRCIESWKKFCPDYEIKQWDESNFDINACPYIREAYEEKQWAFVSDYARLKIIYENGGIYLDTDVEVLRSFDELLMHSCFLGTEHDGYIATGLGFGAEMGNEAVKAMLDQYKSIHYRGLNGVCDTTPCPKRNTAPFWKFGFKYSDNDIWSNNGVAVYPPEYFSPMNYITGETRITGNSYSIHHYMATWHNKREKRIMQINRKLAEHGILARCVTFPLRVMNKFEKLGIQGTVQFVVKKMNSSGNHFGGVIYSNYKCYVVYIQIGGAA